MATRRWLGGAAPVAQVATWTFTVTWANTDVITITIGEQVVTVVTGSTVIATIVANVQAALAALSGSTYPEFAETTWTNTATAVIGTATTPGIPFTAAFTTNSAAGVITLVNTTASAGPNDISTAQNWSGSTLPVAADDVVFEDSAIPAYWGMAVFAAVTFNSVVIRASYTGAIGIPSLNQNSTAPYPEYRQRNMQMLGVTTTVDIGLGVGGGSGRINLDMVSTAAVVNVWSTGAATDQNTEPCLILGTNASNALNVYGQSQVGVAIYGGQTSTLATLRVSGSAQVRTGPGATLGTILNNGGTLLLNSAIGTSLSQGPQGGTTTIYGTGAVAQLTLQGGTCVYNTTGTLGGNTVVANAVLDFSQDSRGKTVTNEILVYAGGQILDPNLIVNAGGNFIIGCSQCDASGLALGVNVKITRATPP